MTINIEKSKFLIEYFKILACVILYDFTSNVLQLVNDKYTMNDYFEVPPPRNPRSPSRKHAFAVQIRESSGALNGATDAYFVIRTKQNSNIIA